jgi:mannosyltransferase OCH1-like enzyme
VTKLGSSRALKRKSAIDRVKVGAMTGQPKHSQMIAADFLGHIIFRRLHEEIHRERPAASHFSHRVMVLTRFMLTNSGLFRHLLLSDKI